MATMTLQIEGLEAFKGDVNRAGAQLGQEINRAMVASVNVVKNRAQSLAPYHTGTLRRSIFTDVQLGGLLGIVAQDSHQASYGSLMEFGTSPHVIEPKSKKALFWKGALNPYRRIQHPGTAPRPFMVPALQDNIDTIKQYFAEALGRVVAVMAGKGAL